MTITDYNFDLLNLQIPVMIYPEPGLADQDLIPWWIIPIAALAGMLLLTLLVLLLWAVNHTLYYACALWNL